MDLIARLGPLAFASRLKRLAEALQHDVSRVYEACRVDFEARWFPVMYALRDKPSMSVTAMAAAIGLTYPAVNQIAGEMAARGLLASTGDKDDRRKRLLLLTAEGKRTLKILEPIWGDVESATRELIRQTDGDFMKDMGRLEAALNRSGMFERVMMRVKNRQFNMVEIICYHRRHKGYFLELNSEWLREFFSLEESDRKILSDPARKIIRKGGLVIFARLDRLIIGTAAVIKHNDDVYELTKMAVTKKARGMQAGKKLAVSAIDRIRRLGGREIVLQTSPKLEIASALYRKLGFEEILGKPEWATDYRRKSIYMKLDLTKNT